MIFYHNYPGDALDNLFIGHEVFSMCQIQMSSVPFQFNLCVMYITNTLNYITKAGQEMINMNHKKKIAP